MKIIDYTQTTTENAKTASSSKLKENITAALLFIIPALLLFILAK